MTEPTKTKLKRRYLAPLLKLFVVFVLGLFFVFALALMSQGINEDTPPPQRSGHSLVYDAMGVPTITAPNWQELFEDQGFVVAGARMFHMDLIRRQASGRLSELFGRKAFEFDSGIQRQDRLAIAQQAVELMPQEERANCEAYARGVNRFIAEYSYRWSFEYLLLRTSPEPWLCRDTVLVLMTMSDTLTGVAPGELSQYRWRRHLDSEWESFLFPQDHPWNKPLFGTPSQNGPRFPGKSNYLPIQPVPEPKKLSAVLFSDDGRSMIGSNNWAWSGRTGTFVVNDPHLGQTVPNLWYLVRLKVTADDFAIGASIPGIPGIITGTNGAFAWSLTNTGEDVDDYLEETVSDDRNSYLIDVLNGEAVWTPFQRKEFEIKIKGEAPERVAGLFTRRGPVIVSKELGGAYLSRQWLALRPEYLRLPVLAMIKSRGWDDFNRALDGFRVPAQNVVYGDSSGFIGYRTTGTGIKRYISGKRITPAVIGEWRGFEEPSQRRRLGIPPKPDQPTYLATANARIWVDPIEHEWASDDRVMRINEMLGAREDFSVKDMADMQLDTVARFRKMFIDWIAAHAQPKNDDELRIVAKWKAWDGNAAHDPLVFTQAINAENEFMDLLIDRVRDAFMKDESRDLTYQWYMRRAWILAVISAADGSELFGYKEQDLSNHLLKFTAANPISETYEKKNRFSAQHPFVANVPLVGKLFRVKEPDQFGYADLVRAEKNLFGPSHRFVWSMKAMKDSVWSLPVGQSGHVRSRHYRDFQDLWTQGRSVSVFADEKQFAEFHFQ